MSILQFLFAELNQLFIQEASSLTKDLENQRKILFNNKSLLKVLEESLTISINQLESISSGEDSTKEILLLLPKANDAFIEEALNLLHKLSHQYPQIHFSLQSIRGENLDKKSSKAIKKPEAINTQTDTEETKKIKIFLADYNQALLTLGKDFDYIHFDNQGSSNSKKLIQIFFKIAGCLKKSGTLSLTGAFYEDSKDNFTKIINSHLRYFTQIINDPQELATILSLEHSKDCFLESKNNNQQLTQALSNSDYNKAYFNTIVADLNQGLDFLFIVGERGSGKTTMLKKLLPLLKQKGKVYFASTSKNNKLTQVADSLNQDLKSKISREDHKTEDVVFLSKDFKEDIRQIASKLDKVFYLVDEAGTLNTDTLETYLRIPNLTLILASTLDGYEGNSLGIINKLLFFKNNKKCKFYYLERLQRSTKDFYSIFIKYLSGSPSFEMIWKFLSSSKNSKLFSLTQLDIDQRFGNHYNHYQSLKELSQQFKVDNLDPKDLTIKYINPLDIKESYKLYQLSILTHYRASINDLFTFFNDYRSYGLYYKDQLIAGYCLIEENNFFNKEQALKDSLSGRRPLGSLVPQLLFENYSHPLVKQLKFSRISRIFIHPLFRRQGLSNLLFKHYVRLLEKDKRNSQVASISYSYNSKIGNFWESLGYKNVYISRKKNKASAEYNAVALFIPQNKNTKETSLSQSFLQQLQHLYHLYLDFFFLLSTIEHNIQHTQSLATVAELTKVNAYSSFSFIKETDLDIIQKPLQSLIKLAKQALVASQNKDSLTQLEANILNFRERALSTLPYQQLLIERSKEDNSSFLLNSFLDSKVISLESFIKDNVDSNSNSPNYYLLIHYGKKPQHSANLRLIIEFLHQTEAKEVSKSS